jgi:hypothetical protein
VIIDFLKEFKFTFSGQPKHFVMNDDQTIVFINSGEDIMIIDLKKKKKVDLEDSLIISDVRCCINRYGHFFVLANKLHKN